MTRGTIIVIAALLAALAALLILPKLKDAGRAAAPAASTGAVAVATASTNHSPLPQSRPQTPVVAPRVAPVSTQALAGAGTQRPPQIIRSDDPDPEPQKPLPTLERDYLATTNRETRLDLMMDIAENTTPEAVKALTRLFQGETDPELKVDLIDSLLGIEGFKEEKLIMLTLGIQQGLPNDVRQSAIDGLIDLEDTRAISLLNGLLNDPDPEIRESAQDAIELLQTPPQPIPKLK